MGILAEPRFEIGHLRVENGVADLLNPRNLGAGSFDEAVLALDGSGRGDLQPLARIGRVIDIRQIVAGIAEVYAPEPLIGRKVIIVANLLSFTIGELLNATRWFGLF